MGLHIGGFVGDAAKIWSGTGFIPSSEKLDPLGNANRKFNRWEAEKDRQFQAEQGDIQRRWEEYMSNTAHQREVEDLIAAGLNPILSATGGNGASTPTAAAQSGAQASNEARGSFLDLVLPILHSMNETKNINSSAKLNSEKEKTEQTQQKLNTAMQNLNTAKALEAAQETLNKQIENELLKQEKNYNEYYGVSRGSPQAIKHANYLGKTILGSGEEIMQHLKKEKETLNFKKYKGGRK